MLFEWIIAFVLNKNITNLIFDEIIRQLKKLENNNPKKNVTKKKTTFQKKIKQLFFDNERNFKRLNKIFKKRKKM